jgi:hypothetical protein
MGKLLFTSVISFGARAESRASDCAGAFNSPAAHNRLQWVFSETAALRSGASIAVTQEIVTGSNNYARFSRCHWETRP